MTHEENLIETTKRLQEKLYPVAKNSRYGGIMKNWETKKLTEAALNKMAPVAIECISMQAEAFSNAWLYSNGDGPVAEKQLKRHLIERGLIPAPEAKPCEHERINMGTCMDCGIRI